MRKNVFVWIALATVVILLVPLVAMQFTDAVNWSISDFVVMGSLLFGAGSVGVLVARKAHRKYWLAIGVVIAAVFLYVWSELAVGIFTKLGS